MLRVSIAACVLLGALLAGAPSARAAVAFEVQPVPSPRGYFEGVATGDLNKDGVADAVALDAGADNVRVFLTRGGRPRPASTTPLPAPATPTSANSTPQRAQITDLDGDGHTDVVLAVDADDGSVGLAVMYGRGDGTFDPLVSSAAGKNASDLAVSDIDGNGLPDVVIANAVPGQDADTPLGGGITILRQLAPRSFAQPEQPTSARSETRVLLVDVAADGTPDLVTQHELRPRVGAAFGAPRRYANEETFAMASGRLNGDPYPDVVQGVYGLNEPYLRVFEGQADGTLRRRFGARYGERHMGNKSALLIDLDRDRDLDAVTSGGDSVFAFTGKGDGTFSRPEHTVLGKSSDTSTSAAAGDFNRDGRPDLFVAERAGKVKLLVNRSAALLGRISFAGRSAPLNRSDRTAEIRVRCSRGVGQCDGKLTARPNRGRAATSSYSVPAGKTRRVRVAFGKGRLPETARVVVSGSRSRARARVRFRAPTAADKRAACRPAGRRLIRGSNRYGTVFDPDGLSLVGCLYSRGTWVYPPGEFVDGPFAISRRYLALAGRDACDASECSDTVAVVDLVTGRARSAVFDKSVAIGALVVSGSGAAAWTNCPQGGHLRCPTRGTVLGEVFTLDRRGARRVDQGPGLAAYSLRVRGDRVWWQREGRRRSARLVGTPRRGEVCQLLEACGS